MTPHVLRITRTLQVFTSKIMKKSILFSALLLLTACRTENVPTESIESMGNWDAGLSVESVEVDDYESSTQLALSWIAAEAADHYRVIYIDGITSKESSIESKETNLTLENLKAGTEYEISIAACVDSSCSGALLSESASGKTSEEYWQIQGKGSSYDDANHVVADGNTLAQVSQLEGDDLKMYYNPGMTNDGSTHTPEEFANQWKGVRIAIADAGAKTFTATDSGIRNVCLLKNEQEGSVCPAGALYVNASQAVPVKTETEEFVRLFFEASETDGQHLTKNYYLDSQDGLTGEDFNPSKSSTICGEEGTGVAMGGECEPTLIIDESDGLTNSRQAKVALPLLDSQYWDMEAGTFMVITGEDTCGATRDGLFYAQWDGEEWLVHADEEGCATPLALMGHGPVVLHLGDDNYKLYYEQYTSQEDFTQKPLKMFYTDGNNFEDFESYETARDVHFVWPDGSDLSVYEESGLGDHFIYLPTVDLTRQYMVLNLGGMDDDTPKEPSTGLGLAILMNP